MRNRDWKFPLSTFIKGSSLKMYVQTISPPNYDYTAAIAKTSRNMPQFVL